MTLDPGVAYGLNAGAKRAAPPLPPAEAEQLALQHGLRAQGARPPLRRYTRSMLARKDLIWELADTSAYARNQGSYLGQAWAVLDPTLLALFYVIVFGLLFPPNAEFVRNAVSFITVGIFTYSYFQNSLLGATKSMRTRLDLIQSHQFPRAVIPISTVLTESIRFFPAMAVMMAITWLSRFLPTMPAVPITWRWLLVIPAFLLLTAFSVGMALIFARFGAALPDLANVLPFFLSFLMFGSGAMFAIGQFAHILGPFLMRVLTYQPVGVFIYLMRSALLNEPSAPPNAMMWFWGILWAVLALVLGYVFFWSAEETYGRE
ncbi:MAG: ABC transporter [Cellulomonadaceae bacterium]|nr:ABC transporter [Cellulomonadaceae bacterium]